MQWQELLNDGYGRILTALENALNGLTREDLNWQPKTDCNSIGWLAWHLTRVQDTNISNMMNEEQLWIKDGWHAKFNRKADTKDTGFGNTPEDVAAFKSPDAQVFILYRDMRTYGLKETFYEEAREKGVIFVRYEPDAKPQVTEGEGALDLSVRERILNDDLSINADLVVLATGMVPAAADGEAIRQYSDARAVLEKGEAGAQLPRRFRYRR